MLIYAVDATLAVMINSSALPSWQHRCVPCPLCRRRDEVGTNGAGPVEPKETAPRTHMSLCWGRCRSYALLEVHHQKGTLENSERSESYKATALSKKPRVRPSRRHAREPSQLE